MTREARRADDMVIMAESKEGLQALSEAMDRWDLKWKKTKVMKVAQKSGVSQVRIGHQVIEQVEQIKYSGVMISKMAGWRSGDEDCECYKNGWRNE